MEFTTTQQNRLKELGCPIEEREFCDVAERDKAFAALEKEHAAAAKLHIRQLAKMVRRPKLAVLREKLAETLVQAGFVQVETPTVISREFLRRMSVDDGHPLNEQVYWLSGGRCLRPMLAPNLYYVSKDLLNICGKPLGIFEVGSCFRKESKGSAHLEEFTMLNIVEWGVPIELRNERLRELVAIVLTAADITEYEFETEQSAVYGETTDVTVGGLEIGSASMGPHELDSNWGIMESWVGVGFGVERLLFAKEKPATIHAIGRSITYLDGAKLNVK